MQVATASGGSVDAGGCSTVANTTSPTKPSSEIFMMGLLMGDGAQSTPFYIPRKMRAAVGYLRSRAQNIHQELQ